jgi:hypothetical protein
MLFMETDFDSRTRKLKHATTQSQTSKCYLKTSTYAPLKTSLAKGRRSLDNARFRSLLLNHTNQDLEGTLRTPWSCALVLFFIVLCMSSDIGHVAHAHNLASLFGPNGSSYQTWSGMRCLPVEHKKHHLIKPYCTWEETKYSSPYGISAQFITSDHVWCSFITTNHWW